ncbi:PhoX family phosphatase [Marinoscillum sp. MHG1-6]|uniref:PhoX family protein n=1 Tax=Marinoscillum sp. MHG1-6 TaxID=2959627 RepID=UPI00215809F2|nr:alkaline phosphatase PhoX [Marinoscillum sp. MHG1-6]
MKRRNFVEFLGKGAIIFPMLQVGLQGCRSKVGDGMNASLKDELLLTDGLEYEVLLSWGDPISSEDTFGYDNDYIAFLPQSGREAILWVNHEQINPRLISGFNPEDKVNVRNSNQIDKEMYEVGGSIIKLKKSLFGGWKPVIGDELNKRITAHTPIPFKWHEKVARKDQAIGTLANCSGGVTPWGTILTCEENYNNFYGERDYANAKFRKSYLGWESFKGNPTEHYGWVVEVNPITGEAQKHVGLGRFAHECATVQALEDGRVVIYTGDDIEGGCLYKYISEEPGQIYPGKLYVANTEKGEWIHLDYGSLSHLFKSETEMLIRCRDAAIAIGGSQLDRPEDIEIDPLTGDVIISLTDNVKKDNHFGSIVKLSETDTNYESLTFSYDTLLTGGEETGFACPDNLIFDKVGNLWFTSDIKGANLGKGMFESFGNNGLYVLIRNGEQAGKIIQVASAPKEAELTGPCFSDDWETLFLSVQHPGERSSQDNYTSNWPKGGAEMPRPSVVAITGGFLEAIQDL